MISHLKEILITHKSGSCIDLSISTSMPNYQIEYNFIINFLWKNDTRFIYLYSSKRPMFVFIISKKKKKRYKARHAKGQSIFNFNFWILQ